jgi:hypothetical protein
MRRSAVFLCLLAALTGTPLRQAEAAADFARSLAELTVAVNLEEVDGGVGDDTETATWKPVGPAADSVSISRTSWSELLPQSPRDLIRPTPDRSCHRPGRITERLTTDGQRHAWLQVYLF